MFFLILFFLILDFICGFIELIHLQRRTGMISRLLQFSVSETLAKPLSVVPRVQR